MANIGRTISVILTSMTAIVSADYIKPFVAIMLPTEWLPPPPAVVWQQPRPQPQSDQVIQPTLAEESLPLQLVSPRLQTESTPKPVPPPKPYKRTRSNKQPKNHKPRPAPKPPKRTLSAPTPPAPVNPRGRTQYPVYSEPPVIRRDGWERPLQKTAPKCWDDLLNEPCTPRRRMPPTWESDPPPPDWSGRFDRRPDLPPPGWRPPPRAWREWHGPRRRFDPERFSRWERRRWRYR